MTHPDAPQQAFPDRLVAFLRLVAQRFGRDGGMRIAASLSYTSLLALVPLATIAFAILKVFPVFIGLQARIENLLFDTFLPETIASAQHYFSGFVANADGLTAIGIVALAVVAVMLLASIETALNDIFRVKAKRALFPRMMMFWAVLTLGPLLLGGSISLTTYLFALSKTVGVDRLVGFGWLMTRLLPTALAVFAFGLFYAIVPYRPVRIGHALIGGLAAGLLFALVRKGFAIYIAAFPAYQTLYGALSTIPIFLIWMYLSWAVVLLGAEITAALPEWGHSPVSRRPGPTERLEAALAILEALWRESRRQATQALDDEGAEVESALVLETLDQLRISGFVALSDAEQWLLARDLSTTTLYELARGLNLAPSPDKVGSGDHAWQPRLKALLGTGGDGDIALSTLFGEKPA